MRTDRSLTCSRQVRSSLPAVLSTILVCLLALVSRADEPPRMKRADAFLGIHFDFHAGDDCDRVVDWLQFLGGRQRGRAGGGLAR